MNSKDVSIDTLGFKLYDEWLYNIRNGKRIEKFFLDNDYRVIAIYGMGLIGNQVYSELKGSDVKVACGIDQKGGTIKMSNFKTVFPNEVNEYKHVDAIVITPIQHMLEIETMIYNEGFRGDVISVEQVIEYVSKH